MKRTTRTSNEGGFYWFWDLEDHPAEDEIEVTIHLLEKHDPRGVMWIYELDKPANELKGEWLGPIEIPKRTAYDIED